MTGDILSVGALLVSLVAAGLAYRSFQLARDNEDFINRVCSIMESRSSRTVVCDLSDGRITVIKELKDAN